MDEIRKYLQKIEEELEHPKIVELIGENPVERELEPDEEISIPNRRFSDEWIESIIKVCNYIKLTRNYDDLRQCASTLLEKGALFYFSFKSSEILPQEEALVMDAIRKLTLGEGNVKAVVPSDKIPFYILEQLANLGDNRVVEPLIDIFNGNDIDLETKSEIIGLFGKLGSTKVVESLINCLSDKNTVSREIKRRGRETLTYSIQEYSTMRANIIDILGKLGDKRAVQPLIEILRNKNEELYLREKTLKALEKLMDKRSLESLIASLEDSEKILKPPTQVEIVEESGQENLLRMEDKIDKLEIINKLNLFISKPEQLKHFFKKILRSDWDQSKKGKWQDVIIDIMNDYLDDKWYEKISEAIVGITGKIIGESLTELGKWGFSKLADYLRDKI